MGPGNTEISKALALPCGSHSLAGGKQSNGQPQYSVGRGVIKGDSGFRAGTKEKNLTSSVES